MVDHLHEDICNCWSKFFFCVCKMTVWFKVLGSEAAGWLLRVALCSISATVACCYGNMGLPWAKSMNRVQRKAQGAERKWRLFFQQQKQPVELEYSNALLSYAASRKENTEHELSAAFTHPVWCHSPGDCCLGEATPNLLGEDFGDGALSVSFWNSFLEAVKITPPKEITKRTCIY